MFLQGGWENDETVEQAAVREAVEEAGVRGDLVVRKKQSYSCGRDLNQIVFLETVLATNLVIYLWNFLYILCYLLI